MRSVEDREVMKLNVSISVLVWHSGYKSLGTYKLFFVQCVYVYFIWCVQCLLHPE